MADATTWDIVAVLERAIQEYEGHADEYDRVADTPERTYDWAKAREQYLADAAALRTLRDKVQAVQAADHPDAVIHAEDELHNFITHGQ